MYIDAAVTARWTGSRRLVEEGEVSTIAVDVCISRMPDARVVVCCAVMCAIAHEPCWAMN
jgi:hypothetical protein